MKQSRRDNIRKNRLSIILLSLSSQLSLLLSFLSPTTAPPLSTARERASSRRVTATKTRTKIPVSYTISGIISIRRLSWFRQNITFLIPFFILVSTTCCTTTTSLSTLGLYKVGTGGANLIDSILTTHGDRFVETNSISKSRGCRSSDSGSGRSGNCNCNCNCNYNRIKSIQNINANNKNKVSVKKGITKKKCTSRHVQIPVLHEKKKTISTVGKKQNNSNNSNNRSNNNKRKDKKLITKKMEGTNEIARSISGLSEEDQKFLNRIRGSLRTVQAWDEDKELLTKCRSQVPWNELLDEEVDDDCNDDKSSNNEVDDEPEKSVQQKKYSNYDVDRLLVGSGDSNALFLQRLCRWFPTFMSWVNAPPCKVCGCESTEMKNVRGPETQEELDGRAKRVEVYYCPECKANTTTFPRYNKAEKLLETQKGRCGEYSNLFGLFCRSVGFETRLVLDLSDHLWTEIRLGDSWIMADGCEGIIDKPSMYEHGWGKDGLCYMIAIGSDHVVDVTPRYTRQFLTEEFQNRRREHTTSEESSERIFQLLNDFLKPSVTKSRAVELLCNQKLENAELQLCKQSTEWTEREKYGSGRISGSLAWKQSRQEAGITNQTKDSGSTSKDVCTSDDQNATKSQYREVAGFPVEAFMPPRLKNRKVRFRLHPKPTSRHDGIVVSDTPCAVGVTNSVSVVVVDNEKFLGCIIQSKSFIDWSKLIEFVKGLPTGRIILMNGKIDVSNKTKAGQDAHTEVNITRLGGWNRNEVKEKGVIFIGQIDRQPNWSICKTLEDDNVIDGYEVEIEIDQETEKPLNRRLRTERSYMPQRIAGRLPEAFMPLTLQVKSTENEKRKAYLKFAETHAGRYCGYTTKKDSPIYLLDSTSYPLQKIDPVAADNLGEENTWNTFLELPDPLVPKNDHGINDGPSDTTGQNCNYDVPLDSAFFNSSLGENLLSGVNTRQDTVDNLSNARLICLYFSAHWCFPCKQLTPILAEMYDYLKDTYPTHGVEIVFVSGDRDEQSFNQYYQTMPWKAIPFDQLQFVKQSLNITYGVRGIPSLVVLDAVSGQVVVGGNECRQEVVTACRGGELRIKAMFESWLGRTPTSTKELLAMLELSTRELETSVHNKHIDSDDNPYLKRTTDASKHSLVDANISKRIAIEFEKLVKIGHDPNSAAATAITIVANGNDRTERCVAPTITPGPLDGKATYVGKARQKPKNQIDQALADVLKLNSPSAVQDVLTTAHKYVKNSEREPCQSKYRSFKLSNKIADAITRVEGGLNLLQALGFEITGTYQDFKASIPVAADLSNMEKNISQLIEDTRPK